MNILLFSNPKDHSYHNKEKSSLPLTETGTLVESSMHLHIWKHPTENINKIHCLEQSGSHLCAEHMVHLDSSAVSRQNDTALTFKGKMK